MIFTIKHWRFNIYAGPMLAVGIAYEKGVSYKGYNIALVFIMIEISVVRKFNR